MWRSGASEAIGRFEPVGADGDQASEKKYMPKQDVQLGKEAASEVRKEYPIIEDQHIAKYLTQIGNRLVAAAATELKQSVYEYSFTPVNLKDINAFALPGGPMFVQRGMFDAAAEEAEVVGLMAHELSRVRLRHGTANATKAQNPRLQLGQIAGAVAGAVVGGELGGYIAEGTQSAQEEPRYCEVTMKRTEFGVTRRAALQAAIMPSSVRSSHADRAAGHRVGQ